MRTVSKVASIHMVVAGGGGVRGRGGKQLNKRKMGRGPGDEQKVRDDKFDEDDLCYE